jgi:hypothetical protein
MASEDARVATDPARHAVVDAVRATADALNASLEQMRVVEDMRRTLRWFGRQVLDLRRRMQGANSRVRLSSAVQHSTRSTIIGLM